MKARFPQVGAESNIYGQTSQKPAPSCKFINLFSNIFKSGFYWIKSTCAKNPVKS